jgi:hypothetical protein
METKFLRRFAMALLVAIGLGSGPASAWLAAESSAKDKHHEETRQAAIALLQQVSEIVDSWLISERDEKPLALPSSDGLNAVIAKFQALSADPDSKATGINYTPDLRSYAEREAAALGFIVPETYSDAFNVMAGATKGLVDRLNSVRKIEFGPSSSTNIGARTQFASLVGSTFRLVHISSYIALLLQYPGS